MRSPSVFGENWKQVRSVKVTSYRENKLPSKNSICAALCFAISVGVVGCGDANKTAPTPSAATSIVLPSEPPEAESFRNVCMQGRSQGDQASSSRDGRSAMEIVVKACQDYLTKFPTGKDKSQVDALYGEAQYWLSHYSKLVEIDDAIEAKQFDQAKRLLSAAKDSLPTGDVKRLDDLIAVNEAKETDGWIPFTLDVEGYSRGECAITQLARNLDGARKWAKENEGWIQVQAIHEGPGKVAIVHYDGLLKAQAVRTFYQDMATCKADRGE
jgi:hypothetical protein